MNKKILALLGCFGAVLFIGATLFWVQANSRDQKLAEMRRNFPGWVAVTGKLRAYQAVFPSQPQLATSSVPLSDNVVTKQELSVASGSAQERYFVVATLFPSSVESTNESDQEKDLQKTFDDMMSHLSHVKKISTKIIGPLLGTGRVLEFVILDTTTQQYSKGRLAIHNDTLYQYWIESPNQSLDQKYTYFTTAFQPAK